MLRHEFTVVLEGHHDLEVVRDDLRRAMGRRGWQVADDPWHRDGLTVYVDAPSSFGSADLEQALDVAVGPARVVFVRAFAPPIRVESNQRGRPTRYVNTYVARSGATEPARTALLPDTDHDVLVHIGDYSPLSLLPRPEAAWPADQLPDEGLLLTVCLSTDAAIEERPIRLPPAGGSTACDCPLSGDHRDDCVRAEWLRLPWRTGRAGTTETAELVVYLGVVAVHVQRLELPVGEPGGRPRSTLQFCLTSSFGDLDPFFARPRTASAVLGESGLTVNGVNGTHVARRITPAAADKAAKKIRRLLYDIHFEVEDSREYSRYREVGSGQWAKSFAEYEHDLHRLAAHGRELFAALFSRADMVRGLHDFLRLEASARRRRPALQIVLEAETPTLPLLWSTVYDLPIGSDVAAYVSCPAVADFGPGSRHTGPVPLVCPYEDAHDPDAGVVCPFGFWGLSCEIEYLRGDSSNLLHATPAGDRPLSLTLAVGPRIDRALVDEHQAALTAVDPTLRPGRPHTGRELARHLALEPTDVAILLAHCGYGDENREYDPDEVFLDYVQPVRALDVFDWQFNARLWPRSHWREHHPLVVLNGCHTVHTTSATLVGFVEQFVGAGASGVIGPEVAITQEVASWAVELLVSRLAAGDAMGEAVHAMRWAMLSRGNVMGLAYSPYCLVDRTYHRA